MSLSPRTPRWRQRYALRMKTVGSDRPNREQFLLRGLEKVNREWLICTGHNVLSCPVGARPQHERGAPLTASAECPQTG